MFRNYIKIAWRNLIKNKLYSFINIGGLSVGICVCMLIMIYLAHEMSFDRFHKNADNIFSVSKNVKLDGKEFSMDGMSYETAQMIKNADPAIENYQRIEVIYENKVIENIALKEKIFSERKILFTDSNFFDFFSFRLIHGDPANVLDRPFTMVLSEHAARKYFGNENPIGKILKYDSQYNFEITGIAADPPSNSSIDYDFIGSISSIFAINNRVPTLSSGRVQSGEYQTFLLVKNSGNIKATENILQKLSGDPAEKFKYLLKPFVKRHMNYGDQSSMKYIKIFSLVAALILFLALINYMSLATARSAIRSKEIGVRKVLGADRSKIMKQFYVESTLYAVIAFLLAVLLFNILKSGFYGMLQLKIDNTFSDNPIALTIFGSLLLVTILIAGSYPSLVLSSFNPVKVLYGRFSKQNAGASIRKFFTVLQFTISVTLIISSIIIGKQLDYFRHTDTGLDKEHVLMIPYQKDMSKHYLAFKNKIENIKGVNSAAIAQNSMYGGQDMTIARIKESNISFAMPVMTVDNSFIELLGLRWKIPPVNAQVPGQKDQVVINEEAIAKLNLPDNPIGQEIYIGDTVRVSGVLKNFNYSSLHNKIDALCLFVRNESDSSWKSDMGGCIFAKIDPLENIPALLESIKKLYHGFDSQNPFDYQFMDDAFDAQFKAEERMAKIFGVFTCLTIFIACMGLFGLAAFSVAQRTKEIGIRKVLGANVVSILTMISWNFIKLVLLSIFIAMPVAWFFMNKWLNEFAYRINIGWLVFVQAALAAILIAIVTVCFQTIKTAIANPVRSLRTE